MRLIRLLNNKEISLLNIIIITSVYKILSRVKPCNVGQLPSLKEIIVLLVMRILPNYVCEKIFNR